LHRLLISRLGRILLRLLCRLQEGILLGWLLVRLCRILRLRGLLRLLILGLRWLLIGRLGGLRRHLIKLVQSSLRICKVRAVGRDCR
jgi:hypothetical protein